MYVQCVSRALQSAPYKKLRSMLREARTAADLTQLQVAERLRRPQSFVSKYEGGERHVDVVEFVEICAALNASAARLVEALTGPSLESSVKRRRR